MKISSLLKIWEKTKEINLGVFPVLILTFLGFALTEEFRPGFFTFYFSEWIVILPTILSGIIFLCSDPEKMEEKKTPTWIRASAFFIFQALFSFAFFWKVAFSQPYVFWGIFFISSILFAFFQWALLFSDAEVDTQWKKLTIFWHKSKHPLLALLLFLILGVLVALFILWLNDPYFWQW